ncbi:unnamed protein product [Caenorhabditis angaria]|uniref:Uncharacterized protein n=1 Tax=Caenorhabditis angaria TaxID=860376 RepID=A0A9P1J4F3_9PELO|nr:unnamed protein product [Caenorhabditis angaria]
MNFCLFFYLFSIFLIFCRASPIPQASPSLGVIHGSPVVAIIHGNSDILKDEVQSKDSEDDPLEKFGKIVD